MNKEEQKKLLIEMMELDEKNGLYETNNMAQQTAVEWLVEQYANENYGIEVYAQAKQMEKEQIIHAWREGDNDSMYSPKELDKQAEQYYNETYGGQGSPDTSPNTQNK